MAASTKRKISIIGAGPAGLTLAYFLCKKGRDVTVYESSKEIGGLAGSVKFWGREFDIGPHIFLESSQKDAVKFWKEIGKDQLLTAELSRGMILNSELIGFPPKPSGIFKAWGPFKTSLATASLVSARFSKKKEFNNAGAFFEMLYGKYIGNNVFEPFCEKYMGLRAAEVDLNFALGLTSFVKDSGKEDVDTDESRLKTLLYPKNGTRSMWKTVSEEIEKKGKILLEKKLSAITKQGDKIVKLSFSDGTEAEPDLVISSLPITLLAKLMNGVPPELIKETEKLKYRNTILVYLRFEGEAFKHHYVTAFDKSVQMGRISNFGYWKNEQAKETVLCVEFWCDDKEEIWTEPDDAIIKKAERELKHTGLIGEGSVLDGKVLRLMRSHPVLSIDHVDALEKVNNYFKNINNLILTGRHATFKWDGQADNISAGKRLAETLDHRFSNDEAG